MGERVSEFHVAFCSMCRRNEGKEVRPGGGRSFLEASHLKYKPNVTALPTVRDDRMEGGGTIAIASQGK